jgi:hypothetical protein
MKRQFKIFLHSKASAGGAREKGVQVQAVTNKSNISHSSTAQNLEHAGGHAGGSRKHKQKQLVSPFP